MLVHLRVFFSTPLTTPSPAVFYDFEFGPPYVLFDNTLFGVWQEGDCLITAT